MRTTPRRGICGVVVALLLVCVWAAPARAATHVWQGPLTDGKWSNAANWSNGVPTSGEPDGTVVAFNDAGESDMDISGLTVDRVLLTGGHNINDDGGAPLRIANGGLIEGTGNSNEVNIDLTLDPTSKITVNAVSGTFGLGSFITGGAEVRFTGGVGAATKLTGGVSADKTVVETGDLILNNTSNDPAGSNTTIDGGPVSVGETLSTGGAPKLKLSSGNPDQIAGGTDVTVGPYGLFDVAADQDIGSLTVNGGRVSVGAPNGLNTFFGVSVTGGLIEGTGPLITRSVTATASAIPAEIKARIVSDQLANPAVVVDVAPGLNQPALKLTGDITATNPLPGKLSKRGGGSLLLSGNNSLSGVAVDDGTLVPGFPALNVEDLSFSPTGSLHLDAVGATVPQVNATGTVTIDPDARLSGTIPAEPAGTQHTAIAKTTPDAVNGQFATTGGTVFTTPLGQPYTATYTGGDGNDVVVTAGSAPQAAAPPASGVTGPGGVTGPSTGAVADRTKPTLGALTFSNSSFRAATSGGSTAQRKKAKKRPIGTKVGFSLTEASSVKFTVQRKTTGRRVKGKCKTATRGNRTKPKCTLWKNVTGSFTVRGKAGKNTFTFRGRIGGKTLKPGSYRLNGMATDPSRNSSLPKQKTFTIVR